jgi:Putative Ig domain
VLVSALFIDPPMTPPTVSAAAATNVSSTSATLNGTVNANGSSTTVSFEWGTATGGPYPNSSPAQPSTVNGSTDTAVSLGIAGLTPETTYFYRVVATNGGGTTSSAERSFTTKALITGTAPQITSVPVTQARYGREYIYSVTATGSPTPTFHLDGSPPAGMVIDATSGVIRWTPASVSSYQVTVRVANGVLPEATQTFTIVVRYEVALPIVVR